MRVYAIASNENEDTVRTFAEHLGLTYPVLLDTDGSALRDYEQTMAFPSAAYPQDWVIGVDGTIVYANNGFEADEMQAAIERELGD